MPPERMIMEKQEYDSSKQAAIVVHMEAIMLLSGKKQVSILTANTDAEMLSELRRILFLRFEEDTYAPKTHRVVAIMAADREPGDAAKAVEDVVMGNADAARVFDAVGEAFGIRADGAHVNLDIHIDNDRVSIESWAPPRKQETVLGTLKTFEPAMRGQCVSAVATDIEARPIAKYAIDQQVYERVGVGYRRVVVTGIFHYRNSATSYQVEDIEPTGEHRQRVWEENALFEDVPDA